LEIDAIDGIEGAEVPAEFRHCDGTMFSCVTPPEAPKTMTIRDERTGDEHEVDQIITSAFASHPHSDQREGWIVKRLRAGNALTLSLVADENGRLAGHIAFSPVQIEGASAGWHGLGPVAVRLEWQRQGIGSALVRAGLDRLRKLGSHGCVVLGEHEFYGRFGFRADPRLRLDGVPPELFLVRPFQNVIPEGRVDYHPAFFEAADEPG
jgi:putative acetyltransferase